MTPPSDPFTFGASGSMPSTPAGTGGAPRTSSTGSGVAIAGPPTGILIAAGVVAVVGIVVGVLAGQSGPLSMAAWLLAGPIAIGILAAYTLADTKRRAHAVYTQQSWVTPAYWTVLVFSVIGIIIGALRVADWVGRR